MPHEVMALTCKYKWGKKVGFFLSKYEDDSAQLGNITGFETHGGSWVGYTGVWVRVAKFVPSQSPYPQHVGMGFRRFFPHFLSKKDEKKVT